MKGRVITVLMAAAVLAAATIVAGCDDDDTSSNSNNDTNNHATLSPEDFTDLYIHALCEKELECCPDGVQSTNGSPGPITTTQDCESDLERVRISMLNTFNDPKVIYDEERAVDCLNAFSNELASMQCTDSLYDSEISECKDVARGTVDEGGECHADYECKDGMHCVDSVCTHPKATGEACSDSLECESYYCDSGVCVDMNYTYSTIMDTCYQSQ